MPICSGDARHQSRKLSKMALNFGRFYPPKFCLGTPFKISGMALVNVQRV